MDRIRNDNESGRNIQEHAGKIVELVRACHEKGLRICGERVTRMDVEGRRRKGRLKWRWKDSVNVDLREKGLSEEETHNWAMCRQLVRNIAQKWEKMQWKTKNKYDSHFKLTLERVFLNERDVLICFYGSLEAERNVALVSKNCSKVSLKLQ